MRLLSSASFKHSPSQTLRYPYYHTVYFGWLPVVAMITLTFNIINPQLEFDIVNNLKDHDIAKGSKQ